VRTSFHDDVARFGGFLGLLDRAFSSHRVCKTRAPTSDVPVAPRWFARHSYEQCTPSRSQRPTHVASRERCAATPARNAFVLYNNANRLALRGRCNTTRDQVAPTHARALARDRSASVPDRASLDSCFRPRGALLREEPLHVRERCISRNRWPASRVRATRGSPFFRKEIHASVGSKRVEDAGHNRRNDVWPVLAPARRLPDTPWSPRRTRNDVGTTSFV